jgi:hypothetical protein
LLFWYQNSLCMIWLPNIWKFLIFYTYKRTVVKKAHHLAPFNSFPDASILASIVYSLPWSSVWDKEAIRASRLICMLCILEIEFSYFLWPQNM